LFANPREATKGYLEIAHDEDARKSALRHTLNDGRHKNIERARMRSLRNNPITCEPAVHMAQTASLPRARLFTPGIRAGQESGNDRLQKRLREIDPQQQIRQAAASG
jgi:hypothetical protein